MVTIRVNVYHELESVPSHCWRCLTISRSVYQELEWYQHAPALGLLRLIVGFKGQKTVALLPLYIVKEPSHYYHNPKALFCGFRQKTLMRSLGKTLVPLKQAERWEWFPSAVTVSPYGYRGGLIVSNEENETGEIARAMATRADQVCHDESVRVAVYHYLNESDDSHWIDTLVENGANCVVVGADCNTDVVWQSLDDYFQTSKKRGRRLRAEYRHALQEKSVQWRVHSFQDNSLSPTMVKEVSSVFALSAKKHLDREPPTLMYKKLLDSWLGSRLLLSGRNSNGSLRSALLVFVKGNTFYPKYFGCDGTKRDYFFLTYYWLLELAIQKGITRIEYGGGCHQAKLLRCAKLRWLLACVKAYDTNTNVFLKALLSHYEAAQITYFSQLSGSYDLEHSVPQMPRIRMTKRHESYK